MRKSLVLALLLPAVAWGGEAWTLGQCIDYALEHNIDLRQKQAAVDLAKVDLWSSQGQLWPSLSASTGQSVSWRPWSRNYVNVANGTMTSSTSETNYNGTYGVSAQWTVWDGGRSWKTVERNRRAIKRDELDADATALSLKEQIATLYTQILYQREAVEVNRQVLAAAETERDRAANMVEVGTMARADLARMEAQVSQCRYDVANASTQLASFRLQLRQLLELDTACTEAFDVASPDAAITDERALAPLPALAGVCDAALASRPEIRAGEMDVDLASLDVDIARRAHWPTVGLSAGINTSTTSGVDNSWADQLKTNLSNMAGVTLQVPIFDNRSASAGVKRARIQAVESELRLEQLRTDLRSTVETLWLNASNAQEQMRYAMVNADAMQESYALVSEQFNVGLKDIVSLNQARTDLLQARQQLLQAKYTALLNRALLLFYQGSSLDL